MSQETAVNFGHGDAAMASGLAVGREKGPAVGPEPIVARLAQFFPDAAPVRIPVVVSAGAVGEMGLTENTVIEYGTPNEVLFASVLPLEFADRLRVRNADGSLDAEVFVVGVQYHGGRTAVAARFVASVKNWIVKA